MRDHLVFYLNGNRHSVRGPQAAMTVTDYLREGCSPRLPGTKVACAEGDCGACTVLVGKANAAGDQLEYRTIDACIAFVYQMDGCHIITVEGLRQEEQLTDVQAAMVECHGSQCGFCTPGFVMAMHGMVADECTATSTDQLAEDEMRLGLSGNLCRCTGYSQILDAGRKLEPKKIDVDSQFDTASILAELVKLKAESVHVNPRAEAAQTNGHVVSDAPPEIFLPRTLKELLDRREAHPTSTLVAGATDLGVQHNHGKIRPADILVTGGVDELDILKIEDHELIIGAAVTWSRVEAFVRDQIPEYYAILTRFGSPQVRHAGSLIGNLANASPIADSIPFHYVAGSTLVVGSASGEREIPIEDFYLGYKKLDLKPEEVILSVRTRLPTEGQQLKLYKISKRRDMDISTVTAAFLLTIEDDTVVAARVATGGVGPTVVRLPQAESLLTGKPLSEHTMREAGQIARTEISPISDVRGSADFRLQLVENLFVKYFHDLSTSQPVEV